MKKLRVKKPELSRKAKIFICVAALAALLGIAAAIIFTRPYFTKLNKYAVQAYISAEDYADAPYFTVQEIRYLKNDFSTSDCPYIYFIKYTPSQDADSKTSYIIEVRSGDNVSGSTINLDSEEVLEAGKAKFISVSWDSAQGKNVDVGKITEKVRKQMLKDINASAPDGE